MRPFLVVLIWVVILGGLTLYMRTRDSLRPKEQQTLVVKPPPGVYEVELTPTFDVQGGEDAFALNPEKKPALVLLLNGREIARVEEPLPAGVPQSYRWDQAKTPVAAGENEFKVELHAPPDSLQQVHGARLRLLRDGEVIGDQTLWSPAGAPLNDVVRIDVVPAKTNDEQPHAH
jgi:hypothetical protein